MSSVTPTVLSTRSLPLRLALALYLSSSVHRAAAYSWYFVSPPKQCSDVTVKINGTDGRPPYRLLIIPSGPTPLANDTEVRRILDVPFDGNSDTLTFQLKYPENSQFVAVVSDASGFGSGGTSVAAGVGSGNDASCFDASSAVAPKFYFSIEPPNQIVTCANTRIWWDPSTVEGATEWQGVIPGGQSFSIPATSLTQIPNQGTGFNWRANIRSGTTLIIVGGDARGRGSAGSTSHLVSAGINPDSSCLNSLSPSSTPGTPAGGTYPTSTGDSNPGNTTESSNNTGAIVGGVIGGIVALAALALIFYFLRRRSRERHRAHEKPLDLLNAEDEDYSDDQQPPRRNELPQFYQPEPFTVPDPTITGSHAPSSYSYRDRDDATEMESINGGRRPLSGAGNSFYTRSGTPDGSAAFGYGAGVSSTGRKGAPPRFRPVNIIQHDDAGPSGPPPPKDDEAETIELPPAYSALRQSEPVSPPPPAHTAAGGVP